MSRTISQSGFVSASVESSARIATDRYPRNWKSALTAPLVLLILVGFVLPVCGLLVRAVSNQELVQHLTNTTEALGEWDGEGLPPDAAFDALATDLSIARENYTLGALAKRLNLEVPGFRSTIMATSRALRGSESGNWRQAILDADDRWGETLTWKVLKRNSSQLTGLYVLTAVDLRLNDEGSIAAVEENQRIFIPVLIRTLVISFTVAVLAIFLGYPTAHLLATSKKFRGFILFCVLLPFTTSILVRTIAWVVLLQSNGLVVDLLNLLGVVDSNVQLIYNRFGVILAMTHIMLPYTILPIWAVMLRVSPDYYKAAISLGASPVQAFFQVYLPQTIPGVAAGGLIVFILSLGYYITPALVGGPTDQMISYYIARYVNIDLNWGQAAALAVVLIVLTATVLILLGRLFSGNVLDRKQVRVC